MDNYQTIVTIIRESPWGKTFDEPTITRVASGIRLIEVPTGHFVCRKGDKVNEWYGVISGVMKLSTDAASGKTSTLAGITAGSWFGEGSMLKNEPRKFDAIALRTSTIAGMSHATFDYLLDHNLAFNRFLLLQINERLGQFIGMMESERLLDSTGRVARCLAHLFNPVLYPKTRVNIEVSQSELGYLCGLSRQRVNQSLKTLQEQGILHVGYGRIIIENLQALKNYSADGA